MFNCNTLDGVCQAVIHRELYGVLSQSSQYAHTGHQGCFDFHLCGFCIQLICAYEILHQFLIL